MASLADELLADFQEVESKKAEPVVQDIIDAKSLRSNLPPLRSIAKIWASGQISDVMERINSMSLGSAGKQEQYELVMDTNSMTVDIDDEIRQVYKLIRSLYRQRLPDLDSLIPNPNQYVKAVMLIGNQTRVQPFESQLKQIVAPGVVMVLTMILESSECKLLTQDDLNATMDACKCVQELEEFKNKIIEFVQEKMEIIAPNISAIVGSKCAAQLVSAAGGLIPLSRFPSCNLESLGNTKKNFVGMSSAQGHLKTGYIGRCDLVEQVPEHIRKKTSNLLAGKVTLAARVDSRHEAPDGAIGRKFREEVDAKIEKWLEPLPSKNPKALVIPSEGPKKRRGGRQHRAMKARYGETEINKLQNRVAFGVVEEEVIHFDETEGLGMLGQSSGTGRIRTAVVDPRVNIRPASKKRKVNSAPSATLSLSNVLSLDPDKQQQDDMPTHSANPELKWHDLIASKIKK